MYKYNSKTTFYQQNLQNRIFKDGIIYSSAPHSSCMTASWVV